jgi:hypothetical protein
MPLSPFRDQYIGNRKPANSGQMTEKYAFNDLTLPIIYQGMSITEKTGQQLNVKVSASASFLLL